MRGESSKNSGFLIHSLLLQSTGIAIHQPPKYTTIPCSVLHPDVVLPMLDQLSSASMDIDRSGCSDRTGFGPSCMYFKYDFDLLLILSSKRSPRRLLLTPIEKETRRKIWWGVYTLDRMLAIALGRPLGVNDSDCDVELPVDVDDEHLPEYFAGANVKKRPSLMTGIIALIKLYEIGGRVLRQVYSLEICKDHLEPDRKTLLQQTVETLDVELTKWCDELPIVFKSQSDTDEQVSMGAVLCSHYYSMLTTLHRNLLPVKHDQPVTARSTAKAVSSARSCIRLAPSMKHVVPPSHHLAFFIQHLFSSAVIVLLYAMHASDPRAANAAMEEARSTLLALESWEGHWPGARKCKDLLVDLVNTASEAIAHGKAFSATSPSQATNAGPSASPVSSHERRRSVTIVNPATITPTGRTAKGRRRTQSRDPVASSSRRMAAVSPYRVDGGESVFCNSTEFLLIHFLRSTSKVLFAETWSG
jgi:hypothetical protein